MWFAVTLLSTILKFALQTIFKFALQTRQFWRGRQPRFNKLVSLDRLRQR